MASTFFNTNIIYDNKPCLETFADTCFRPVRCLFHGHDIREFQKRDLSYPDRSVGQVALAIVLFIPAIIFGTLAKLFAMVYSQTRDRHYLAASFEKLKETSKNLASGTVTESDLTNISEFAGSTLIVDQFPEELRESFKIFLKIMPGSPNFTPIDELSRADLEQIKKLMHHPKLAAQFKASPDTVHLEETINALMPYASA
jgi:hypothetical protein